MYYKYSVLSETGNEINGIEEGSLPDVKERLREKNYYILALELDLFKSIRASLERKKLKSRILSVFFEDLSNNLKTGIVVKEAIICLQESSSEPVLTKALEQINDDLDRGFSLAEAFKETRCFPGLVLSMLKVGEKSGDLERVLQDLAAYYSRESDFRLNLKNAMIYPLTIFFLLIGIMFYVSFKVIPHLEGLISVKGNAYFATRALLFLSGFLRKFWFGFFILPPALIFIYARFKRSKAEQAAYFYCRIPLVGEILKDTAFNLFFSSLALLERNGISITDSLTLIYESFPYNFLKPKILKLKDLIVSGLSFWQTLEKDTFFPKDVYYTVKKGEEMGRLDEYLDKLSEDYSKKVNRKLGNFLSMIQPILLVLCAGFLLLIVSAFIIPVYSNLSNIAGGNVNF